jgi:hypothetical protein
VTSLHDGNIVFTSPLLSMSQHWWNFVDVISNNPLCRGWGPFVGPFSATKMT